MNVSYQQKLSVTRRFSGSCIFKLFKRISKNLKMQLPEKRRVMIKDIATGA